MKLKTYPSVNKEIYVNNCDTKNERPKKIKEAMYWFN